MKTPLHPPPNGFTLVELLVVIAIIAVLAGAGFAAGNAAIQKAKKTTALATCTALESAVNNFYTEYGAMPSDTRVGRPATKRLIHEGVTSSQGSPRDSRPKVPHAESTKNQVPLCQRRQGKQKWNHLQHGWNYCIRIV